MFGDKNIPVRVANRTSVIQPVAGHIGGLAIAHYTGSAVLPDQTRAVLLHCYRCSLDLRQTCWCPARCAGGGGAPLEQEEIKEEEICCSYVDQISERRAPVRETLLKGTSVA